MAIPDRRADSAPSKRCSRFGKLGAQILAAALIAGVVLFALSRRDASSGAAIALESVLECVAPADLGIAGFEVGRYCDYEWCDRSKRPDLIGANPRVVRIEVLRELRPDDARSKAFGVPHDGMHWLRLRGARTFRGQPMDVYRLVAPATLHASMATPAFVVQEGYFPIEHSYGARSPEPGTALVDVGEELLHTVLGEVRCRKFEVRTKQGTGDWLADVWTSSSVAPLGVVRARTLDESMEVTALGQAPVEALPASIAPLVDGRSTLAHACDSCHGTSCQQLVFPPR